MTRLIPTRIAWGAYIAAACLLFGVETTYPLAEDNFFRQLAGLFWMACSVVVLGAALVHGFRPLVQAKFWSSRDHIWYLLAYAFPTALVFFDINGIYYTVLNNETTQQMANALDLLHDRRDLGIFNLAFLGNSYPARQYLLAAIPSYLFGRSLFTLRLGYAALYLIGYFAFVSSLRGYLEQKKSRHALLISSFSGVLISLANYPLLFARLFEQTIVPLAATLLFLAGLLLFLTRPAPLSALWVLWAFGFLPYCYSPALSTWVFGAVVLAWLCFPYKRERTPYLAAALAYGVATLVTSIFTQFFYSVLADRFHIGDNFDFNWSDWLYRYFRGFHATFGLEESVIPAPLMIGTLLILGLALRQKDFRVLLLCLWAGATVFMGLTVRGYTWRPPEFDVHRSLVILPPLSLALALYLNAYWKRIVPPRNEGFVRGLIASCIVLMILNSIYLPFIRRGPAAYNPDLESDPEEAALLIINHPLPAVKCIYLDPPLNCDLEDILFYFVPGVEVRHEAPPPGEHKPGTYVISFISNNPGDHDWDQFARHTHPRPFLQLKPE